MFVGRTAELDALTRLLSRDRLVSVVGPGGSGKTRLASEAIRRGSFDVHGFVELAPVRRGDALAPVVVSGCGLRDEPGSGPLDRLRDRLGRGSGLLVVDNCEQIRVEVAELVVTLLRDCPELRVLATSRVTLGVTGETVLSLRGFSDDGDASQLFLDRARRVQPGLPSGSDTDATARRICRLADGLPLAIELAAAHARALPLAEVEVGMSRRLRFLTTRDPGALPQHGSLLASIAWSAELVGDAARQVLARLAVIQGRFTLEAALAVSGPGGRAALETLVDHCLVQFEPGEARYVLLDTIRDFAATELGDLAVRARAHALLIHWVADFARGCRAGLGRAETQILARVQRDDDSVRSALAHALRTGSDLDLAAGIVVDLAFAWFLRGRCAEGRDWASAISVAIGAVPEDMGQTPLKTVPPPLRWAEAFFTAYCGQFEEGQELAEVAARQAAIAGDRQTEARSMILVGIVQMFVDPSSAERVLAGAAELAAEVGDDWGQVEALQSQAYVRLFRTDHRSALALSDATLPALDRLGHAQLRAWDAAIRADVAAQTGRFAEAYRYGRMGVELAVGIGEPVSATMALLPLVRALCELGRVEEAAAAVAAHAPFADDHPGMGTAEGVGLAEAFTRVWADPNTAQLMSPVPVAGAAVYPGHAAVLRAIALLAGGDTEAARAAADDALRWTADSGNREIACAATLVLGMSDRAQGRDASEPAFRALGDAIEAGLIPLVADALDLVAGVALDADRATVAARLHAASGRLRSEMGCVPSPVAALLRGRDEPAVGQRLDADELARARRQGGALSTAQAVSYATRSRGRRTRPSSGWSSLTPTELEVVTLAAAGLGNRAIGSQLLITEGTVRTHLRHVFAKLDVRSRSELAGAAARRGL